MEQEIERRFDPGPGQLAGPRRADAGKILEQRERDGNFS